MKILICYFSGTGNTEKVIKAYEKEFLKKDCQIELFKIEDEFNKNINSYDKIGIAYPVHAFNAPPIVVNFVKKLEIQQENKEIFIIKTSGEPLALNNISSKKILKILKKKNFVLTNEYHYVMPYNMIFRHSNSMAYKMWQTAQNLIPIDCLEILHGKEAKIKPIFLGGFLAWIFRIEHWGGKINGKLYKVNDKCIHCQKCVRRCPVNNIEIRDGKFLFKNKCIMCMRCSFMCPVDAFKIGLLNGWKVNGPYNFEEPQNTEQKSHKKWCKKSYEKYFEKCQKKIEENAQAN